ncbi:cysteine dioxygenase family protein [Pseudoxanthomonas dokdonensis]|uniref:Cysteine dioxygenase n=1 Tax=Pseudoxanthomonas dokdonensis TaxID=344882 RepID=A0A0R0CRE6_9GAMM|nr:cysteine dioxygenase family protein [Pseudoxanthomonas dokdonensis]KRG68858.1 cysteine dioxygenase [Pseudoxanthomonas dokdonensis]
MALEFPGQQTLIAALDAAVVLGDAPAVTDALRSSLCSMIRQQDVRLPECVFNPIEDHYARRELYTSAQYGYSVVAMTWGPGQGTRIHDHSGLWCVEGVWHGRLEITQYELAEQRDDHYRFNPVGTIEAGIGSAGSLIPPHEYHTIRNPSDSAVAVSLHVYQRTMVRCGVYSPDDSIAGGPWQRRGERLLGTDQAA